MAWQVKIHCRAHRFLEDLPGDWRRLVEDKLRELVEALDHGVLPYRRLDIRKLRGKWEGFLRLRVGNIRVIFRLDFENKIVYIYNIHNRKSTEKEKRRFFAMNDFRKLDTSITTISLEVES